MYVSKDGKLDFIAAWKLIETKVREHQEKLDMVRRANNREDCPQDTPTRT